MLLFLYSGGANLRNTKWKEMKRKEEKKSWSAPYRGAKMRRKYTSGNEHQEGKESKPIWSGIMLANWGRHARNWTAWMGAAYNMSPGARSVFTCWTDQEVGYREVSGVAVGECKVISLAYEVTLGLRGAVRSRWSGDLRRLSWRTKAVAVWQGLLCGGDNTLSGNVEGPRYIHMDEGQRWSECPVWRPKF